ncbi:MAG TPA: RsmD family RNA methyltransferase [Candidatus Peribacterales bacterium]|nr:RsmD family RNA methyltransferase [Candidatus Peribacterales bacterium]
MPSYCVFLGHQPQISLAELTVMLPDLKAEKQWDPRIVTIQTSQKITVEWLAQLGGTVLIAEQVSLGDGDKKKIKLEDMIPKVLHRELKDVKRKATFSFRCLGVPRGEIRGLYRACKKHLKAKGMPSRYIGNERHPAKPGTLLLRGIPGPGSAELVILQEKNGKNLWIGKTCAVQDIEEYTSRDMGKPFRDTGTGLLPPKLAQVLLNLATSVLSKEKKGTAKDEQRTPWGNMTVWDPFCGSGVIVLEALLRRAHVLGSDRSEKAVQGCKENVRWLRLREKTPKAVLDFVFKHNALKPLELPKRPTLIVTETSLGPALKKPPTKQEVRTLIKEAEEMESDFLKNMATLLPDVPIVCTFPVYIARDGSRHFLEKALTVMEKVGYRRVSPANAFLKVGDRQSLLYLRPDQLIGREIFCLLPPKR